MKKKQLISGLLLAAIMLGTFSCGGETPAADTETAPVTTAAETVLETAPDTSAEALFTPALKEELGLDGYEFNVFLRQQSSKWSNRDLYSDGQDGEILNDAVYKRNLHLEETYGYKINVQYSVDATAAELSSVIISDDDIYDAAFPMGRSAATMALEGGLEDLNEVSYLNLDSDVWSRMFNSKLSYNGRLYYAAGDISINSFESQYVMMFNKTLAETYMLDDPYQLVRDGKWTLDVYGKMCAAVADDLNGDSKMNVFDQWGLSAITNTNAIIFYYGTGEMLSDLGDDGVPELTLGSDRSLQAADAVAKLFEGAGTTLYVGEIANAQKIFEEGRALFYSEVMYQTVLLRSSEVEFGVLPLPKLNEEQSQYFVYQNGWCISPVVIPKSASNAERSGFVLQTIAEASHDYVRPAYYDTVLIGKNLRDDESAEMLDIIYNSFSLDPADIYQWSGGDVPFNNALLRGNLASYAASQKSRLESAIEKTTAAFNK